MRTVSPDALDVPTFPILTAEVKAGEFREHFPIRRTALDALAEAEPSEGALVRLKSGEVVHLTFGTKRGTLSVSAPANSDVREIVEHLTTAISRFSAKEQSLHERPKAERSVKKFPLSEPLVLGGSGHPQ